MAKLIDSTILNGNIMKIIETQNGYILNGQYYDKNTFNPLPFAFLNGIGYEKSISMNKTLNYNVGTIPSGFKTMFNMDVERILIDNQDPKISYSFVKANSTSFNIVKVKEDGNSFKVLYNVNNINTYGGFLTENYYTEFCGFLKQDNDFIYYLETGFHEYNNTSYGNLYKIDKKTGIRVLHGTLPSNGASSTYGQYRGVLALNKDYFVCYSNTKAYIYKFMSNGNHIVITEWDIVAGEKVVPAIKIEEDGSGHFLTLRKDGFIWKTNISAEGVKTTEEKIDLRLGESQTLVTATSDLDTMIRLRYMSIQGKEYVIVTKASCRATALPTVIQVILKDADAYTLIKTTTVERTNKNYLTMNEGQTLIFCHDNLYITIYQFNVLNNAYELASTINVPFYSIGIDKNETLYVYEQTGELSMYSVKTATSVELSFESDNYKYSGENIATNLILSAKNFNGNLIQSNITLTIKGPMIFEGDLKQKLFTTSNLEAIKIPVTINGPGNISIYPKVSIK